MNISDDLRALPKWTQSAGEELANSISHGMGLHRRADRDADPALGRASARQCRILYRHDRFYFDNVVAVSWIDALPRVAADAREIHFACARSFRHFLADRWDIYAVRAGSASRCCWSLPARAAILLPSFPAPREFYVVQNFSPTIRQKRITVANGSSSQASTDGMHQRRNSPRSVTLAGKTVARNPS